MTRGDSEETLAPSRRALLKAAAAGGVFAVPLIASFSMDTASAQTKAQAFGSSNQVVVSNMFCSNMTSVPTSAFVAQLQQVDPSTGVPGGPVVGLAGFQFVHRRHAVFYDIRAKGTLSEFAIQLPSADGFVLVTGGGKKGRLRSPDLTCINTAPQGASLHTVYSSFAAGGSTVEVELADGTELEGTIVRLDPDGPFGHSFSFTG